MSKFLQSTQDDNNDSDADNDEFSADSSSNDDEIKEKDSDAFDETESDESNDDVNDDQNQDDNDEEDDEDQGQQHRQQDYALDSDSSDQERVILTKEQKFYLPMRDLENQIQEKSKNKDFISLLDLYLQFNKFFAKAKKIVQRDGVPRFYTRTVILIENLTMSVKKKDMKGGNKLNALSWSKLKQQVRKNNKQYIEQIVEFKKDPVWETEDSEEEEEEVVEVEEKKEEFTEDSSSDSEFDKDSSSESSDDDVSDDDETQEKSGKRIPRHLMTPLQRRAYWLNSYVDPRMNKKKKKTKDERVNQREKYIKANYEKDKLKCMKYIRDKYNANRKQFEKYLKEALPNATMPQDVKSSDKEVEMDSNTVKKLVKDIKESKKKNMHVQNLNNCHRILTFYNAEPLKQIETYLILLNVQLEYLKSRSLKQVTESQDEWNKLYDNVYAFFLLLKGDVDYSEFGEIYNEYVSTTKEQSRNPEYNVYQSFDSFVSNLSKQLQKSLLQHQLHPTEYQLRLRDVPKLILIAKQSTLFFEGKVKQFNDKVARDQQQLVTLKEETKKLKKQQIKSSKREKFRKGIENKIRQMESKKQQIESGKKNKNLIVNFAYIWLENIAHLHDNLYQSLRQYAVANNKDYSNEFFAVEDTQKEINDICQLIYQTNNVKKIQSAMLLQVYHHAIHNRYREARTLLFNTGLSETSFSLKVQEDQQLYNRAIVSVGMCAFRLGKITDCRQQIPKVYKNLKLRELLGQAKIKNSPIDEKKLLPKHKQMDSETVEQMHYTSTMLIDIQNLSKAAKASEFFANPNTMDMNNNLISKNFWQKISKWKNDNFFGQPETYFDIIYVASNQLLKGNWRLCYDNLMKLSLWDKINYAEETKANLLQKVKEYAFRCYLFYNNTTFDSLSLTRASELFELDLSVVKKILGKLIYSKELNAVLDYKGNSLIFYRRGVSKIQQLGEDLLQKVKQQVKQNEKLLDKKSGIYGFSEEGPTVWGRKKHKRKRKHQLNYNYKNKNKR